MYPMFVYAQKQNSRRVPKVNWLFFFFFFFFENGHFSFKRVISKVGNYSSALFNTYHKI